MFTKKNIFYFFIFLSLLSETRLQAESNHKIAVIGTGYVGLVAGACLADFGHIVMCCDIDTKKIEMLNEGHLPIYEIGLQEIVDRNFQEKRLIFTSNIPEAIRLCDSVFICVGTPSDDAGKADLRAIYAACKTIGENINGPKVIFVRSTVPPGTVKKLTEIIQLNYQGNEEVIVAFTPEFLREGVSVKDFCHPERVVIGTHSEAAKKTFCEIFHKQYSKNIPFLLTSIESAETIKYASNAFLAVKVSFINEMSNFCDLSGADIVEVAAGMGLDSRIGSQFLKPGPGYGGSCFPKDTLAILNEANVLGVDLKVIQGAVDANEAQMSIVMNKLRRLLQEPLQGKTIAILGLAFKSNTDDVRYSPALKLINSLILEGAKIKAYDPEAMKNTEKQYPEITYTSSWKEAAQNADAMVLTTDWEEFFTIDLPELYQLMKAPFVLDTRNIFSPEELKQEGFIFDNMGHQKR